MQGTHDATLNLRYIAIMTSLDPFLFHIINEAFWSSVLPFIGELHLPAMYYFGGYNIQKAVSYAIAPSLLGSITLYGIGRLVFWWLSSKGKMPPCENAVRGEKIACLLSFSALLAPFSLYGFIALLGCGVYRLNLWMVFGLALLAHGLHYQALYL